MREGRRPSLGQQLDLCGAFLEIMAVRMEGRLQPVVRVPEGLRSAVFPSMMLQTLVENAIKHGLEPTPEGGRLEIGAEVVDGELLVHVIDTGVGFMPKAEGGVGLANVRERLKGLYNGRAELLITAQDQCAISAFEHGAIDYLLKPAEAARVALTCQRLRERLKQAPDPMNDLLAQLSQRLGGGVKPREYMRWVQASVGANIRMI